MKLLKLDQMIKHPSYNKNNRKINYEVNNNKFIKDKTPPELLLFPKSANDVNINNNSLADV